jgi:hypothetical protein
MDVWVAIRLTVRKALASADRKSTENMDKASQENTRTKPLHLRAAEIPIPHDLANGATVANKRFAIRETQLTALPRKSQPVPACRRGD